MKNEQTSASEWDNEQKFDEPTIMQKKQTCNPNELAKFLKERGEVYWWPAGGFFVVTDYELAKEVMMSKDYSADRSSFFISRMPNLDLKLIKDFFGVVQKMMVMSDDQEHKNRRRIAALGINDGLVDRYIPIIEKTVDTLIEKAAQKGYIEFVDDIAEPLPSTVLADIFCIDEKHRKDFYKWSKNMTQFFGGASKYRNEDGIEVNESATGIRNYFENLINDRTKEPRDDFISAIIEHKDELKLDLAEIISQAVMMLVAGQVTTTDQLANNMYTMMSTPNVFNELRQNPNLLPTAIEEFNRLDPGVTFLFRVAREHSTIGKQKVKPGDVIFIANHVINRDEKIYEQPYECILNRSKNVHFAYGYGSHYCIGARLAKIQMSFCFDKLIRQYPKLRLDPNRESKRKHYSLAFSGFESIHLLFS